ncbi:MAG: YkgJ family cysteine cluster protein [Spirochaetaceae bacterium]|jgi:Fe-S-cluster containining protein|nr:YkgJ family cysteine cluster protein [Spirochaetaceae bacterium]
MKIDMEPFYRDGLRFSCKRCSFCCRAGPGFVFLSRTDAESIAKSLDMRLREFIQAYCRWVEWDGGKRLSLKEKASLDCVFWKDGCSIYETRPVQCKTYPFWASMLGSEEEWRDMTSGCPGAGSGELLSREYIEASAKLDNGTEIMTLELDGGYE